MGENNAYFDHHNRFSRFRENDFLYFTFPLHNSPKNEIFRLSLGEMLYHMGAHLWR